MHLLYNLGVRLYSIGIALAAYAGNAKAQAWINGRKKWQTRYPAKFDPSLGKVLWMHVSSLGEFEQGRPVLEAFRLQHPDWRIALTFFSPSGYEVRKHYPGADFIAYLPADTPANARYFLQWLNPQLAIFVKYDLWANYLFGLKQRGTPTLLISALFREKQVFFKWYGGFWRNILRCFTHVFLQHGSVPPPIDPSCITLAGDTRIDRVLQLAQDAPLNPVVQAFSSQYPTLVCGSTWPADEAMLFEVLKKPEWAHLKVIVAPHEVSEAHVLDILDRIGEPDQTLRYAQADDISVSGARWLIIDNIGLLNTLYRYGWAAYIGGGFGKGIHNTLEPAAWGLPVLFGPKYHKFEEAKQMVALGGAFSVSDAQAFEQVLKQLNDPISHRQASEAVLGYLNSQKCATDIILQYICSLY